MKLIFSCLALFFALHIAKAQDKIITNQQDTILCRILSISQTYINYEQKEDKQYVIGKFIPIEQVLEYYRSSPSQEIKPYYKNARRFPKSAKPWVIGLQAGGTSLLASSADAEKEMQDIGIEGKITDAWIDKQTDLLYLATAQPNRFVAYDTK
jgi:hypothetical protein